MKWNNLTDLNQLDEIIEESNQSQVLIFKHSHTCSISITALNRLERNWNLGQGIKTYFLDLLTFRKISNAVEAKFGVQHESPQVLIIEKGESVYDRSHFDIDFQDIKSKVKLVTD